jgi:hypothetical protein
MNRADVTELHYITAIANVPSILRHGILSHTLAEQLVHDSVAMPEIQEIRTNKQIPGGRPLHEYANLYFDGHNPMLSKCRARNNDICVLQIDSAALDLDGVIVTDRNAARRAVRFYDVATGLAALDREKLYAEFWLHRDDPIEEDRHKALKCAEVLAPDRLEARFVIGAYIANRTALKVFQQLKTGLPARTRGGMFFQVPR